MVVSIFLVFVSFLDAKYSVVTKDALCCSVFFCFLSSFLLLCPLSCNNMCLLLLAGNKCYQIETITLYAEWSQCSVGYFFLHSNLLCLGFQVIRHLAQWRTYSRAIYSSLLLEGHDTTTSKLKHLQLCVR